MISRVREGDSGAELEFDKSFGEVTDGVIEMVKAKRGEARGQVINWMIVIATSEAQFGERGREIVKGMVIFTILYVKVGDGCW